MNIQIGEKNYKLYTEVIKGKNVISYLELADILQDEDKDERDLIQAQLKFLCSFLNNKFSITQLERAVDEVDIEDYSSILFDYMRKLIDHRLSIIFSKVTSNEVVKEKSIFDDYDRENGYEELIVEDKKILKDIIYAIYDYGTQNGNSFQDMNERINFVEYLDYFDFIVNRKPKEEVETDSDEE